MRPRIFIVFLMGLLLGAPAGSEAQWSRRRSGVVYGPAGPLYDMRSPEWKMAGGNIFLYEQLMQQKMMVRQQQLMMKQQQQLLKQQRLRERQAAQSANPAGTGRKGKRGRDSGPQALAGRRKHTAASNGSRNRTDEPRNGAASRAASTAPAAKSGSLRSDKPPPSPSDGTSQKAPTPP
jgi:hypothetical protein